MFKILHGNDNQDAGQKKLVESIWQTKDGKTVRAICPYCGHDKCYVIEGGKRYKCGSKECYKKFSVTVGTIFESKQYTIAKVVYGFLCSIST